MHLAERLFGGFNATERGFYKRGLQHIANQHERPGQFTIYGVISDEHAREVARTTAAIEALRVPPSSQHDTSGEAQRVCDSISATAPGSVHGCQQLDDHTMLITVDADDYNAFGAQDQKLIRAGYFMHWEKVWEADHPDRRGESDLYLGIKDLVGNDLGFFTFASARVN